ITDSAGSIDAVMAAAEEHGACFFGSGPLRLDALVKEHYLGMLGARFPDLLSRYQRAYTGAHAPRLYRERLDQRIAELRGRYRFDQEARREEELTPAAHSNPDP